MTDTSQYIDVSRTLAETGTFSVKDPATGKLAPFAMRVPLFHACLAVLIKLPGRDIVPKFVFANILLSSAIAVLTGALFCSLAGLLPGALLLFALVAYLTLISSFTTGYDRYRLPIDPFLAGLAAIALGTERVKRLFAARPRSARP